MASLFTSTYPLVHHVMGAPDAPKIEMSVLSPDFVTMAEFLQGRGMETMAVSSQPWCNSLSGFDQGFDGFETVSKVLDEREAEKVVDRALEWLNQNGGQGDFFLYVHMMGPHYPYIPPPGFKGRLGGDRAGKVEGLLGGMEYLDQIMYLNGDGKILFKNDPGLLDELTALYDEEVLYADAQVGRLVSWLEDRDLLDEAMVIVLSDHGEQFLEHDGFTHGIALFPEEIEVPLVIHYPPLGERLEVGQLVSLIDLYPALLDIFAREVESPIQGVSLLKAIKGEKRAPILTENAAPGLMKLTDHTHSLLYRVKPGEEEGDYWLYDLRTDAREIKDVKDDQPDVARKMVDRLGQLEYENSRIKVRPATSRELSQDEVNKLKAIGYLH